MRYAFTTLSTPELLRLRIGETFDHDRVDAEAILLNQLRGAYYGVPNTKLQLFTNLLGPNKPPTPACSTTAPPNHARPLRVAPLQLNKPYCNGLRVFLAVKRPHSPYRLELLSAVPAYNRKARKEREFERGQLVYYGPKPDYYGIGEVKRVLERYVAVDFRGTGSFGVHEDVFEPQYLIPIPKSKLSLL